MSRIIPMGTVKTSSASWPPRMGWSARCTPDLARAHWVLDHFVTGMRLPARPHGVQCGVFLWPSEDKRDPIGRAATRVCRNTSQPVCPTKPLNTAGAGTLVSRDVQPVVVRPRRHAASCNPGQYTAAVRRTPCGGAKKEPE